MSQVIVTNDSLKQKRLKSAKQEHGIDSEGQFQQWRKSDITGKDYFESTVGYALLPVVVLWGFLTGLIAVVLTICEYLFKGLGGIFGGKRRLA